jgi:spore germination cell wall hydrolase CwlJ-like protein
MILHRFAKSPRRVGAALAGIAAAAVLGVGLGAAAWPIPEVSPEARELLRRAHGDLSNRGLERFTADMDPAALAIARRHDPQVPARPWGVTPGWENYELSGRPDLGFDAASPEELQRINAAIPAFQGMVAAAKPFAGPVDATARTRAIHCLTDAVYYEAALEPREGQEAVAQVVLNRVRDPDFPNSVCGVVFQGADQTTGCQFSFTCDGSMARPPAAWAWKQSEDVAKRALGGYVAAPAGTATHYHADYVMPYWTPTLVKLGKFGRQIFYRWRGQSGETSAFVQRYAGREPAIDEAKYRRPKPAPDKLLQAAVVTTPSGRVELVLTQTKAGRRRPDADQIARINAALAKFEQGLSAPTTAGARAGATAPSQPAKAAQPAQTGGHDAEIPFMPGRAATPNVAPQ